jgi:uncharacterized protein (DUF433 family)
MCRIAPVLAGSRISPYVISERLRLGDDVAMLLDDFPHLDQSSIELALACAEANPKRGRPRHAS